METVDLMAAELVRDPFGEYSRIRERAPLARGNVPGMDPVWLVTRYDDVRLVMGDARFVNDVRSVPGSDAPNVTEQLWRASGIPEEYLPYLRAGIGDIDGRDHTRLRKLVTRAFSVPRVKGLRSRVEEIAGELLDELPGLAEGGVVDLLRHFAYPLPILVICELVGIPVQERPRWREWSAGMAAGFGPGLGDGVRGMVEQTRELIELRRREPADDLITGLVRAQDEDGDRLSDVEMISLVVNLVVAGHETTANLIGNGIAALLTHPDQLALLRQDEGLLPRAVQELMRWCGPGLGARVRYATEDLELGGGLVRKGEAVMPVLAGANYDPRAFDDPARLDILRDPARPGETHVGFGHGAHYCLGAGLARQEGEVALGALLRRFPGLALAGELRHGQNPGTWHFAAVPVRLGVSVVDSAG